MEVLSKMDLRVIKIFIQFPAFPCGTFYLSPDSHRLSIPTHGMIQIQLHLYCSPRDCIPVAKGIEHISELFVFILYVVILGNTSKRLLRHQCLYPDVYSS